MPAPESPKDKTPPPMKEGGVQSGQPSEKKSFGDQPPAPDREGGMASEGAPDREPKREGGMLGEG